MLLPRDIRDRLRVVFNIPRSGITEVRDTELVSDGTTFEDLAVVTSEKMSEYVGSQESFGRLWDLSIAKAKHELNPPIELKAPLKEENIIKEEPIKNETKKSENK